MAVASSSRRARSGSPSSGSDDAGPSRSTAQQKKKSGKKDKEGNDDAAELDALDLPDPAKTCKHLFLQTLISRKTMSKEMAMEVYAECVKMCKVDDPAQFETFIANLEPGLALCGMDIKVTRNQETGEALYVLVNTIQDEAAKKATEYNANHIAFFRAVVEKIMTAPKMSYSVNMQEAVRLAKAPITKNGAQVLIESFLAKGWLTLHPSGRFILSPRSLVELSPYLRETFDDEDEEEDDPKRKVVVNCSYCLNIVTSGYACPSQDCGVRLHKFCVAHQIQDGRCPDHLELGKPENQRCRQVWPKDAHTKKYYGLPVGVSALKGRSGDDDSDGDEDAEMDLESSVAKSGKKKKGTNGRKSKKRVAAEDEEEEDEDEGEVDDEDEKFGRSVLSSLVFYVPYANAGTSPAMRKSSRSSSRKKVVAQDSDEDEE
ncbi:hypothetical protein JCM11251_001227 [Rhodosporidiobolus azoricus]